MATPRLLIDTSIVIEHLRKQNKHPFPQFKLAHQAKTGLDRPARKQEELTMPTWPPTAHSRCPHCRDCPALPFDPAHHRQGFSGGGRVGAGKLAG